MIAKQRLNENLPLTSHTYKYSLPYERERRGNEAIAITGIGCRFPMANGPRAYWNLLQREVDAITEIPSNRFDLDEYYDSRPGTPGKISTRWGGFLEDIDRFDAEFFGISPREASRMDPQQRLLLEVTWEALEDAGQIPSHLIGSNTGVFIGMCYNDYEDLEFQDVTNIDVYVNAGGARSACSGRLSYALGLEGPSIVIDTACSSSLVAVHLACQSLRSGETQLAIAGAVNLILQPESSIGFSRAGMLASDGRCKVFDARADGFVRSEGVGIVILKTLSQAIADGDPVYAIIRGSATNNDGRSSGFLMTPGGEGQKSVIRKACQDAGILPGELQYVEAHGTGTQVGDPIEVKALGEVLSEGRIEGNKCFIGSVKANIGHTEGAAGMAGLIKTALALKHKYIPSSLHFYEPNPSIPWEKLPLVVPSHSMKWPLSSAPALAGVSAFGLSGTNAHVILEEAPGTTQSAHQPDSSHTPCLLSLSAHRPDSLQRLVESYKSYMQTQDEPQSTLRDICYTTGARRDHHNYRLACTGRTQKEFAEKLDAYLAGELNSGVIERAGIQDASKKIAFVFSGHGSQYVGMGRSLFKQEPIFRNWLIKCDQAINQQAGWSLLEELFAEEPYSRLSEIDVVQPALFAIQVALAQLWISWGVKPDAVVGHSMGEVAAACVAGALSLDDAVKIICQRSQLMKQTSGRGGMALVEMSYENAIAAIDGYEELLSVAAINGPTSTVLSGDPIALREVLENLERKDIYCRMVKVDVASHSPQMDPLCSELEFSLAQIRPLSTDVVMCSTVTAAFLDGAEMDAGYWRRNLRQPVKFAEAITLLRNTGYQIFIEVSSHPVVSTSIQKIITHLGNEGGVISSLRREQDGYETMLQAFGELYTMGYPIDFQKFYSCGVPDENYVVAVPLYTWQRERYWYDGNEKSHSGNERKSIESSPLHDCSWPGGYLQSASQPGGHYFQMSLSLDQYPEFQDHCVKGQAILPAAAYMQQVLMAAEKVFKNSSLVIEHVVFKEALVIPQNKNLTTQLAMTIIRPGEATFKLFSLDGKDSEARLHAMGIVRSASDAQPDNKSEWEPIKAACLETRSGTEHYRLMALRGLQYGPAFQGVEELWKGDREAAARLRGLGENQPTVPMKIAFVDASLQVLEAALPESSTFDTESTCYLPIGFDSFRVYRNLDLQPAAEVYVSAFFKEGEVEKLDECSGDVFVHTASGEPVLEARGMRVKRIAASTKNEQPPSLGEWFYEVQWEAGDELLARENVCVEPQPRGAWLILADADGVGEELAAKLELQGDTCYIAFSEGSEVNPAVVQKKQNRFWIDPVDGTAIRQFIENILGDSYQPLKGIVYLWNTLRHTVDERGMSSDVASTISQNQLYGCETIMHLVQALASVQIHTPPRLWLVSRGAHNVAQETESISPAQSMMWGLGRGIRLEYQNLNCSLIDLSYTYKQEEVHQLFLEIIANRGEDQIALRDGHCYVARLAPRMMSSFATSGTITSEERTVPVSAEMQYHLKITSPGEFETLSLHLDQREAPGAGEVEIRVVAAGLNFIDVMKAMGIYPGQSASEMLLGIECAGVIVAVGEGVAGLQVGDDVMAVVPTLNAFSGYVTVPASFVANKPKLLTFEEAATTPIAFLTAYYALHHQAQVASGERVLIHSAAGGVGLAAVRICQQAGAAIYATAGSPEKRAFLKSLGINHIYDSRSIAFAEGVMRDTGGEGVDIVLNSLAGEAIQASLEVLRDGGRFLEIGKQDIYQNTQLGMLPFRRNISFSAIHLDAVLRRKPDLLADLCPFFENESFQPLPVTVFPVSDSITAFRHMAQAKHIGKIALSMKPQEIQAAPKSERAGVLDCNGTYLITGGMGALGGLCTKWLVDRGARHLILMGRTAPSNEMKVVIDALEQKGVNIQIANIDVSQSEQLAQVLDNLRSSHRQLKGVIHAAGLLDDGLLQQMTVEQFRSVLAPKVMGAWNLHTHTLGDDLDFFIMFSSVASLIGSPGQTNYAAGNAFLDGLAHYRRGRSLPALSINWGPWTDIGMAAQPNRGDRLAQRGIEGISPDQGIQALEFLFRHNPVQMAVMPFNCSQWVRFNPSAAKCSLYAHLLSAASATSARATGSPDANIVQRLLAASESDRQFVLEGYLSQLVTKVLCLSAGTSALLKSGQSLNRLGMDSLMALELKNLVEKKLNVSVPIARLLGGASLAELSAIVFDQLSVLSLTSTDSFGQTVYTDLHSNSELEREEQIQGSIPVGYLDHAVQFNHSEWEEAEI